jgi:subtilisin-like proprotein convertase family protein
MPILPRIRALFIVTIIFLVALPVAMAATELRPAGRFDDRVRSRDGGVIAVEARAIENLEPSDGLRVGWEEFRGRHGGRWKVLLDERTGLPSLVSGRGIEWLSEQSLGGASLEQLETRARAFLASNRELLGDWTTVLELDTAASAEIRPGHWQLLFRQRVDGVRVENARLELHVVQGRMAMFGATHWGVPTTRGTPTLDADEARAAIDAYLGVTTADFEQVGEPELTMIALDADRTRGEGQTWTGPRGQGLEHALIWRLRFRDPAEAPLWVAEVDAHDGSVIAFFDGAHYDTIRGGVFPISNEGDCAAGGCEIAGFPMPFADYTESGQSEAFADTYGTMTCADPAASVETNLIGPYIRVDDVCGPLSETGTCGDGVDLGLKRGENCEVEPGASAGNTAAARSAYYHLNRVAEAARFYDPTNTWLSDELTVNVNIASTCNAYWNGEINMYGGGNGCGNTGELHGVLVHEWGHGLDANDGGGMDNTSEAYADVVSIFAARQSCVSPGMYNDGSTCSGYGDTCLTCTGLRDHDWAARERNTPTTPTNFVAFCPPGPGGPCRMESHCESYPISEAIYDFAVRDLPAAGLDPDTAWQLAERLWYETRPGSGGDIYSCIRTNLAHSCFASHWFQRMLVADDDDGDLSNGTPHAAALYAAFKRHGIACGGVNDPENQSTSSCPTLAAPVLTVVETAPGTELSWTTVAGADEYRVYRGDMGCNRQQVPIASLPGTQQTFVDTEAELDLPRHYRVEAFGTNHACHSPVSNCASTPLGARLQVNEYRLIETGSSINDLPEPGETVKLPVTLLNSGIEGTTTTTGTLRLLESTKGRVLQPEASWADIPSNAIQESADPHFEMVVLESTSCGDTLTLEFDADAANAVPTRRSFQIQMGDRNRDFVKGAGLPIPPETTSPVTSTLVFDEDQSLSELDVSINIFHQDATELIVELMSPEGTTVRLHDQSTPAGSGLQVRYDLERAPDGPGTMDDFVGESVLGTWTLSAEDVGTGSVGNGTLVQWSLHTTVAGGFGCQVQVCGEPTPTEAVGNLRVDASVNGSEIDLVFSWDSVAAAAGYHVLESTDPTFSSTMDLTGRTAGPTTFTAADGAHNTPDVTFFQVKAINTCNQEGP